MDPHLGHEGEVCGCGTVVGRFISSVGCAARVSFIKLANFCPSIKAILLASVKRRASSVKTPEVTR